MGSPLADLTSLRHLSSQFGSTHCCKKTIETYALEPKDIPISSSWPINFGSWLKPPCFAMAPVENLVTGYQKMFITAKNSNLMPICKQITFHHIFNIAFPASDVGYPTLQRFCRKIKWNKNESLIFAMTTL